jgi:hypothetical protein
VEATKFCHVDLDDVKMALPELGVIESEEIGDGVNAELAKRPDAVDLGFDVEAALVGDFRRLGVVGLEEEAGVAEISGAEVAVVEDCPFPLPMPAVQEADYDGSL